MILAIKKFVLGLMIRHWERRQMIRFNQIKEHGSLYIVDIDNTLTISELGKELNHLSPQPRKEMISYVRDLAEEGHKVIFLSARDFRLFQATEKWLNSHMLPANDSSLFLVSSARAKLPYLELAINRNTKVIYIDDLTYNYENGEIKNYSAVIKEVQSMKLDYLGQNFIADFS